MIKLAFIKKLPNGMFQVCSRTGKNLGKYHSYSAAKKRLNQIEMFKHMEKDAMGHNSLIKVAKEFQKKIRIYAHEVNGQWHIDSQYGQYKDYYNPNTDTRNPQDRSYWQEYTGWHKHPYGDDYSEPTNGPDEAAGLTPGTGAPNY